MLQTILNNFFSTDTEILTIMLEVSTHNKHPDHAKFRASDAGKCHRMRYWKRQGLAGKRELTLELQMAMQTGNLLHAFVQYALGEMGVLFAAEMALEDDHRIGHLDALVKDDDKLILYDFKTVGGKQMYYLKQDERPKSEHVLQVMTYHQMYINTNGGPVEYQSIDECRIAYISRDTLEMLDLSIHPNNTFTVNADWEKLVGYWERQETPPMVSNNWECKYCPYNSTCMG